MNEETTIPTAPETFDEALMNAQDATACLIGKLASPILDTGGALMAVADALLAVTDALLMIRDGDL